MQDHHGWIPADEHERKVGNNVSLSREDEDEYEDVSDDETAQHGTQRTLEDDRSLKGSATGTRNRREQEALVGDD